MDGSVLDRLVSQPIKTILLNFNHIYLLVVSLDLMLDLLDLLDLLGLLHCLHLRNV